MKADKQTKFHAAGTNRRNSQTCYITLVAFTVYTAFQVYRPALHGPFVFDDFGLPFYNPSFRTEQWSAWITGVRPLLMFSYWLNFLASGRDTFPYHVTNVLLHLANSAAVYLVARRVLTGGVPDRGRREILSAFAAALFLLHPIQTESVAWVAGRSECLGALFFLYALVAFLYRPAGEIGWRRSASLLALFGCAVAAKEHTATLPFMLLMTEIWWTGEHRVAVIRRNWRLYVPMVCMGVIAGTVVWRVVGSSASAGFGGAGAGISWSSYALTQCRVIFIYLRLFLLPVGQNIDYDIPWSPTQFEFGTFAAFAGILTLTALAWRLRRRFAVGSYGFLVFLLLLAPTSSFIPLKDPIAEHRIYLPMLGLALVACEFLNHLVRERKSVVAVAGVLIIGSSVIAYQRNRLWGSEAALWLDTVAKSPNKLRAYGHLVHGLVREGRCREALQLLDDLSRRKTIDSGLLVHWAFAYECVVDHERAIDKLEQAAAQSPNVITYLNIARNQLALSRDQDAIQTLNHALELDPNSQSVRFMLGKIYEHQGHLTAPRDYRRSYQWR
jgi:pentatricopeptide repeat protein